MNEKRDIKEIKEIINCTKNESKDLINYIIKVRIWVFLIALAISLLFLVIFNVLFGPML